MVVNVPARYLEDIDSALIDEILKLLNLERKYEIEVQKRDGRNIIINTDKKRIYVILSAADAQQARNSFLNQSISTVLKSYTFDETGLEKEIFVFLMDVSSYAQTPYMIDTYRILKTLNIDILNERNESIDNYPPYSSISEWKEARSKRQEYNPGNNSTYVLENVDSYTIFGKTFGANGKEATLISCMVACIAKNIGKTVLLFQVEDNESKALSTTDKELVMAYGVKVEDRLLPPFGPRQYNQQTVVESVRNQAAFQLNLLNKYGSKKCIICGNDIEETIIASHIHRVTDISNSSIPHSEKCKEAVDPDNGFWLCANHDKMFEVGLFFFVEQSLKTKVRIKKIIDANEANLDVSLRGLSNNLLKRQLTDLFKMNSVTLCLKDFVILDRHYTDSMHYYLEKHRERVKGF